MKKYAYVYAPQICISTHILSLQLTLVNYLEDNFDIIEIEKITKESIEKYDVVCVDHFAIDTIFSCKNKIEEYLKILSCNKNVAIITRDLHEWTFCGYQECTVVKFRDRNLKNIHPSNVIFKEDIGYVSLKKLVDSYSIKNIISLYDCSEFNHLINYTKCNPHIVSLHVDTQIFKNLNIEKDIDILIYGADLQWVYPLRNKIKNVVKNMNIKYHIIDDVHRHNKNNWNQGLANLLNRSWLTVCTCSIFDYLVQKYFEATACGSVVIGNMATQGKEIWKDNYIDIPHDASDTLIQNTIINALANKEKLKKMSDIMSKKISTEYNYNQYSLKLKNVCEKIEKSS